MVAALTDTATPAHRRGAALRATPALLVQRELDWRDGKRVARLLKAAKLKVSAACVEDIDWRARRGLDRHLLTALSSGDWIRHGCNVLITGATGLRQDLARLRTGPAGRTPGLQRALHQRQPRTLSWEGMGDAAPPSRLVPWRCRPQVRIDLMLR